MWNAYVGCIVLVGNNREIVPLCFFFRCFCTLDIKSVDDTEELPLAY